jgi:hypothetical protein
LPAALAWMILLNALPSCQVAAAQIPWGSGRYSLDVDFFDIDVDFFDIDD